jgi:hypothetical protein
LSTSSSTSAFGGRSTGALGSGDFSFESGECEGEDSNLHGSNPTSTSTEWIDEGSRDFESLEGTGVEQKGAVWRDSGAVPRNPGGEPEGEIELDGDLDAALRREARALLECAAEGRPVSAERTRAFARACIEATVIGRAALGALEGGPFAGPRLVELASQILVDGARRTPSDRGRAGSKHET